MKCKVCNSTKIRVHYKGKIRYGKFGQYINNQRIYLCENCHTQFFSNSKIDYTDSSYRTLIQTNSNKETYYANQDKEQLDNIEVIGFENLRGKTIADVGCGAGSFLDVVRGFTKEQIAIEPYLDYQSALSNKGYRVFDFAQNVDNIYMRKVDIVTSFAVIEHVEDPKQFLSDMKRLVADGGYILISTPNSDDWMLDLLPETYKSFFYRYVHNWYFNKKSLEYLANELNFKKIEFIFKQKYDLSNLLLWLRDKKPSGLGTVNTLNEINCSYKKVIEKQGISNYLYAKLYV